MSLLHYTNHPLVDVGIATLTAMSHKPNPESVTLEDLEQCAQYLQRIYTHIPKMRNQLNSFFQNSHFTQGAMDADDRFRYADQVLFGFREDRKTIPGVACTYFPENPAYMYAYRQHVPLLNGRDIKNFLPAGLPGLPVSGAALLAIHALPLGCMKCKNWMAFHQLRPTNSDAPDMTLLLALLSLRQSQRAISLMEMDSSVEFKTLSYHNTRYVEAVVDANLKAAQKDAKPYHITGYYFTNFGSSANIEIVRLDNSVVDFVYAAQSDASSAWARFVARKWQPPKGEPAAAVGETDDHSTWRNDVYEQLFRLPAESHRFLKLLASANDWNLITIFLRKVMLMEQARIDTYRALGDRLIEYMDQHEANSLGFYHAFARARSYEDLRRVLRVAAESVAKAGDQKPLFTYDEFIFAFEHPSEGARQWRLGRDLIGIRMLELLHKRNIDLTKLENDEGNEEDTDGDTGAGAR